MLLLMFKPGVRSNGDGGQNFTVCAVAFYEEHRLL
jgi:hypothetical protein